MKHASIERRRFLSLSAGAAAWAASCHQADAKVQEPERLQPRASDRPVLVGSANGLPGMQQHYPSLAEGAAPLDVAIEVVKIVEADPDDTSVGLGGLPNEDGVVQLDAAVMDGTTHNAGAVACIENILHPSEVARLVMERTDHVLIVGPGAYRFARAHGHPHVELLTESTRKIWMEWKETMSKEDDRLPPRKEVQHGSLLRQGWTREEVALLERVLRDRPTGTIHCSALSVSGEVACTTTTSGLAWKIPGRVGDSPLIGCGLYCDAEVGSAGGTGRGEAAILANGSSTAVELMRQGATPLEAGLEVLRRVTRQAQRASKWQPELVDAAGVPTFGLKFYLLSLDGSFAGVSLLGGGEYAVADPEKGARLEPLVALHPGREE